MIFRMLFILFLITSQFMISSAQGPGGRWEGKLNVGVEVRMVFHIKPAGNGFTATADSPDQQAFGLPCDSVSFFSDSLMIWMNDLGARFEGKLINDSTIVGQLIQGAAFPVTLKKTAVAEKLSRPQIPQAPYPYSEEKITYPGRDTSLRLAATLSIPDGKGPFPAVVLITGSGPQDRNSTVLGHPLFMVLADHLTRNGVMVLRYDERGIGESTGTFATATSADFANDVHAALDYLKKRKEADLKKIGLIGHSEGGMIAPLVATSRSDVSFVVLLAAPGVPHIEMMAKQNEEIARSAGMPETVVKLVPDLFKNIVSVIRDAPDRETARKNAGTALNSWITGKDPAALQMLQIGTEAARQQYISLMVEELKLPWFDFFIRFDPTSYLTSLKGKVLALNGTRDIQVIHSQNLSGIEAALKKSKAKHYTVKKIEGLNHLFQSCNSCTLAEYGKLEETFSPVALNLISDWINEQIK